VAPDEQVIGPGTELEEFALSKNGVREVARSISPQWTAKISAWR
jgi:hypothetical protein